MNETQAIAFNDQQDRLTTDHIRKFGWQIVLVGTSTCACCSEAPEPEGPSFAYTVGLFGLGHPELLIFSAGEATSGGVLNDLGSRIKAGEDLMPGQLITFENWPHRIICEEVPNPGDIVFAANRHFQRPSEASVPVLQLTYDDKAGRFPWDPGYANPPEIQPRPGTFRA